MNFAKLIAFVRTFQQNKVITHRFMLINLKTNLNTHCNFFAVFLHCFISRNELKTPCIKLSIRTAFKITFSCEVSHYVVQFLFPIGRLNKMRPFKTFRQTDPNI